MTYKSKSVEEIYKESLQKAFVELQKKKEEEKKKKIPVQFDMPVVSASMMRRQTQRSYELPTGLNAFDEGAFDNDAFE